jgi:hypothetical protein
VAKHRTIQREKGDDSGMSETLTYNDALSILGRPKSRLVTALDATATVGLTAWAAATFAVGGDPGIPLGLVELKSDVIGYAHTMVRKIGEWRKGLSRFDRSQRLAAAHAVLVITSYFEALEASELPVPIEQFGFTRAEQTALATSKHVPDGYVEMIELLANEPLPLPEPHRSFASVCEQLINFYDRLSLRILAFISGLTMWDKLAGQQRERFTENMSAVPTEALRRYKNMYNNLAADNGEFQVWAGLTELHALGSGLAGVTTLLSEMVTQQVGRRARVHLTSSYRAVLNEPIAGAVEAPETVVLPSLEEAYVNPRCRVAEIKPADTPAVSAWWAEKETITNVEAFLAGYLTSPRATRTPLIILGEPGSGKSKLMEILAARLPEQEFLPVLVQLRDVGAESMVQEQIEEAIYHGPGDRVSWHELREAAGGNVLPVVLLDGFDELVQAAAVNRYDYLEQVRDFQRNQARIGHPVSVIVTSRTIVADYVRFPGGSIALQLLPFNDAQIRRWLRIWSQSNRAKLRERGLRPLTVESALAHRDLAAQPLLLMMLAIFDANENTLQRGDPHIGRADLYERLLSEFTAREVTKSAHNRSLSEGRQKELAETEIQRLAMVAVAMFTRGRQSVTEAELDRDLPILFPADNEEHLNGQTELTQTQRATGHFFFIHKSEARSPVGQVRSFEFLHSTFGEYLMARAIISGLRGLVAMRETMQRIPVTASSRLDDGFLYAMLSFSCLSGRTAILDFLRELLQSVSTDTCAKVRRVLPLLLTAALYPHSNRSLQEYEPVKRQIPRRLAAYTANIMLMLVLTSPTVSACELFGDAEAAERWRQYGFLWRGALTHAEWRGFSDTIRARVAKKNSYVDIRLSIEDSSPVSPLDSLIITEGGETQSATQYDVILTQDSDDLSYDARIPASSIAGRVFRDAAFMPSWHASVFLLQSIPAVRALNGEVRWQSAKGADLLPAYLLAVLDYTQDDPWEKRASLYAYCADRMAAHTDVYEQLMLRLKRDAQEFPLSTTLSLLRRSSVVEPTRSTAAVINTLWRRFEAPGERSEILKLARDLLDEWRMVPGLDIDMFG